MAGDSRMSSSSPSENSADGTSDADREEFMKKLQAYHDERGCDPSCFAAHCVTHFANFSSPNRTTLEVAPKVGTKVVDYYKLYRRVTAEGGYDAVSDIRSNKLMWRKIGQDFHLGSASSPTLAFTLKSIYYKNLTYVTHRHPSTKAYSKDDLTVACD